MVFGWKVQQVGTRRNIGWPRRARGGRPGINGAIMRRKHPEQPLVNSLTVANSGRVEVAAVLANGGSIAVPKMAVPGVGWLAYCKDPEGTIFGTMPGDPSAGKADVGR